jgi:hypothetical protein
MIISKNKNQKIEVFLLKAKMNLYKKISVHIYIKHHLGENNAAEKVFKYIIE